jgi:predicted Zn-dependent protease
LVDIAAAAGGVNTNGEFTKMTMNAGAGAYSVEFEQEADYVGLYFMATAGFKIDDAPLFWRRMATNNSQAISMKSSHPTTPDRFVAIESTVKEINQKIANNQPLKPEMKGSSGAK